MSSNFVPCLTWVKRGVAQAIPNKVQLTQEELKEVIDHSIAEFNAAAKSEAKNENVDKGDCKMELSADDKEIADEYDLDNYEDDDDETNEGENIKGNLNPFLKPEDLAAYTNIDLLSSDPYLTQQADDDEWEQCDKEDFEIKPNDNLLLVGHVEDENSVLEIYVHNEEEDSLYVHHDIHLPAFPVAVEWLDYHPSHESPGNYVAVGDMTAQINVWNLDVVDLLEPEFVLKKRSKKHHRQGHSDAVLDLSWNKFSRNKLASGSADTKICLWDLQTRKPYDVLELHSGKVQSIQWHPFESQFLLSGCTDGVINVCDCNSQPHESITFQVEGEIERVLWDHFNPFCLLCSTDKGDVHCMDIRSKSTVYSFPAHKEAVTGLTLSHKKKGCLITASTDKTFKIWDISDCEPQFKLSHKAKMGSIFVAKACPDSAFFVAFGGNDSSRTMVVKDITKLPGYFDVFSEDSTSEMTSAAT